MAGPVPVRQVIDAINHFVAEAGSPIGSGSEVARLPFLQATDGDSAASPWTMEVQVPGAADIAMAVLAAIHRRRCIITLPSGTPRERVDLLQCLGAEVEQPS